MKARVLCATIVRKIPPVRSKNKIEHTSGLCPKESFPVYQQEPEPEPLLT